MIRFDDVAIRRSNPNRARLDPISSFFDKFINQCQVNYSPNYCLTIDEMMIPFRGRCAFKIYMPAKPCKYGIKLFALVGTKTKYLFKAIIYTGKQGVTVDTNQSYN